MVEAANPRSSHDAKTSATGGGFDFFRKYQRVILYTAGIFALLSFSITGALIGFFAPKPEFKGPKLTLPDGRVLFVTEEDWNAGAVLMRSAISDPTVVLPSIASSDGNEDLRGRFAALRRLAVEFGIQASDAEVDRAIEQAVKIVPGVETPTQLALGIGYPSLKAYRLAVREALRVGTFLRLQCAATDTTDAALVEHLLENEEMLTLRVATLDKKAREKQLEETGVSDADLQAWLAALPDEERAPFQEPSKVALHAAGLVHGEFAPADYAAELGHRADDLTDDALQREYEARKGTYFRNPLWKPAAPGQNEEGQNEEGQKEEGRKEEGQNAEGQQPNGGQEGEKSAGENAGGASEGGTAQATGEGGQTPPAEGAAATEAPTTQEGQKPEDEFLPFESVKEQLKNMLLAEAVIDTWTNRAQTALAAHIEPAVVARNAALRVASAARAAHTKAREQAEADASSTELAAAADAAKAAMDEAQRKVEEANRALDERRKSFDFLGEMTRLCAGRKGFHTHRIDEPVDRVGLEQLGELGKWSNPAVAQSMTLPGDLATQTQKTDIACFSFQVPQTLATPLKPFADIADQARAAYFAKRADEEAKADKEKVEKALLELAKGRIAEKVAELEAKGVEKAAQAFADWKSKVEADLAKAIEVRATHESRRTSSAFKEWDAEVKRLQAQLDAQDRKRSEIEAETSKATDAEIETEAKKVEKDVLEEAIAGTGFTIHTVGPYSVNVAMQPRFRYRYSDDVRFLFSDDTVKKLKPGEITGILDDATGRALHIAVCETREHATVDDLTRRELALARPAFVDERLRGCMEQSFTSEALKARWGFESLTSKEEEEEDVPK